MVIEAIIFDVDGTLSQTEEAHRQAFNDTFPEFDLPWVWSRELYGELLKTTGGKERMTAYVCDHLGDAADPDLIARIHVQKTARYGALISGGAVKLRPGIAELIGDAKKQGIRLAIATTTNRPNVDRLVEATSGVPAVEVFKVIAAGDEVKNKKPASDVFDLAVSRLGLDPSQCVGVEDSRDGLLSCIGAGVACIVSPGTYTHGSDFSEAAAVNDCFSQIDTIAKLNALLGN